MVNAIRSFHGGEEPPSSRKEWRWRQWRSPETLVPTYRTTWCHYPNDHNIKWYLIEIPERQNMIAIHIRLNIISNITSTCLPIILIPFHCMYSFPVFLCSLCYKLFFVLTFHCSPLSSFFPSLSSPPPPFLHCSLSFISFPLTFLS
jgi:hypothetical protein